MSLANFSLPFQTVTPSPFLYAANEGRSIINNLRLNAVLPPPPAPAFTEETQYRNDPYIRYQHQAHQQQQQQQQQTLKQQRYRQAPQPPPQPRGRELFTGATASFSSARSFSSQDTRYTGYDQDFRRTEPRQEQQQQRPPLLPPNNIQQQQIPQQIPQIQQQLLEQQVEQQQLEQHHLEQQQQERIPLQQERDQLQSPTNPRDKSQENYPERPNGYTRVNSGSYTGPGAKTSVHAVLDYDDDEFEDYYDDENPDIPSNAQVTPIQGPIFVKNGTVPVVPLYSYPQLNNGTLVQIPILWTALSVALGVELRGDLVRGAPCIKKYHQLFCPTAGNSYPIERIERFIDENKALMKRMYGDFEMNEFSPPRKDPTYRRKRTASNHDIPNGGPSFQDELKADPHAGSGDSYFNKIRNPRQSFGKAQNANDSGRVDACESKVEIVTPYWSTNSAGKVRAIVNTQHFEQAIHQEVCSKTKTNRCSGDCGCEQKYKWHRLLAYDPDNDCKGIFMDWFLYPSCCVCRCDPSAKFPGTATTTRT